jgi:(2Fe-2S) ferredoxin
VSTPVSVGVVLCRGCCCGDPGKNPEVDHAAELARFRRFAATNPGALRVDTSDCLGPCGHANVIVVRPSGAGRRLGGRPAWFGMLDDHAVTELLAWVTAGGPGLTEIPGYLDLHRIPRPHTASG